MVEPARISVIVLAYGREEYLAECVTAALAHTDEDAEILLVDNGADTAVAALPAHPRLRITRPGRNLGYAGGCNYGAELAVGDNLVFLNSDAVCRVGSVEVLVSALRDPSVGLSTGDIRLAESPELMNSAGNPMHFLGIVWAGSYGEPATAHSRPADVATASGAFFATTRSWWQEVGGFDESYFAYHEDADLSLRTWQRGRRVVFVPGATVLHHYEFSRNPQKQYLLERNRWLTVLTVYPAPLLLLILPLLALFEVCLVVLAARQGWLGAKLRGWRWLASHVRLLRRRRKAVQAARVQSTGQFARLLSGRIEPAMLDHPPGLAAANVVLAAYWRISRIVLGASRSR
jgi:GT2 family glycosyltransferase